MSPVSVNVNQAIGSFPRVSGDEPNDHDRRSTRTQFSPRERG